VERRDYGRNYAQNKRKINDRNYIDKHIANNKKCRDNCCDSYVLQFFTNMGFPKELIINNPVLFEAKREQLKLIHLLKTQNEKEVAIHQKKMDDLHKKEEIKAAKEKMKLDKINKKREEEEKEKQKRDAEAQIKEQQMLMREERRKQETTIAIEKKRQQEIIENQKKETPKQAAKLKRDTAKEEKLKLKQEKIQRKKELAEEKKKFKERNTYVNDKVVIEKKSFGDYINSGLEKFIKIPKLIEQGIKKKFSNSAFAKNKRNEEDMHREALLIDFTGEDAKKSNKKLVYEYVGKNAEGKLIKAYFEAFSKGDMELKKVIEKTLTSQILIIIKKQ
jgi:hypothetical protein